MEPVNSDKSKINILIVDSVREQAEKLKLILMLEGYSVNEASNGIDAVSMLEKNGYSIIISEVYMPDMDGFKLCSMIKCNEKFKETHVMLLSSLIETEDVLKALECQADDFISKPFDEKYLLKQIENLARSEGLYDYSLAVKNLEIAYRDKKFFISSDINKILNFLIASYETAVQRNHELSSLKDVLSELNINLEKIIMEKTEAVEREILERTRAESEAKKISEQLALILDYLPIVCYMNKLNEDFVPVYISKNVKNILGFEVNDFISKPNLLIERIHPDDKKLISREIGKIMESDLSVYEYRWQTKNGNYIYLSDTRKCVMHPNGERYHIGLIQDITEKKKSEKLIIESENRFRMLLESVTNYIYTVNIKDGKPFSTIHGPACVSVTGYTSEEYAKNSSLWYLMIHEEDRNAVIEQFNNILKGKEISPVEHRIIHKNGSTIWVRNTAVPRYNESSELTAYDGLIADITNQKEYENVLKSHKKDLEEKLKDRIQELEIAKNLAEKATKSKSEFLANMSHELRTPLNSIIGFSDILDSEISGSMNAQQHENIKYILASGKHLLSLINDILDIAKIEAGKIQLEFNTFPLKEILENSLAIFSERAIKNGIRLDLVIDNEADTTIEADARRLKQILFNLLSNAIKFTPENGTIRILVKKAQTADSRGKKEKKAIVMNNEFKNSDFVEISIIDSGIGIKAEDMPKLFKEFTQLESTYKKTFEGTGLGLALTKKLIELHGGNIWVNSEVGKGSKFSFVMPLKKMPN